MKGTDLTQAQIDAAERFILARRATSNLQHPKGDEEILQRWSDFIRIVAWYGAIRYKAGSEGLSSLDNPGDPTVKSPKES